METSIIDSSKDGFENGDDWTHLKSEFKYVFEKKG